MEKNKVSYIICLVFSALLLSQCISYKKPTTDKLKALPASFSEKKDSSNSASLGWVAFFKDPDLIHLINEGLANNLDYLSALQRMEMARYGIKASQGALLPSVAMNISAAQRKYGLYTMDGAGNISTEMEPGKIVPVHLPDYYAGLQTSWEIDIWKKLRNKKKAAVARYLGSVEGKNLVVTNLITEIALHYYELLALDNQLDIVKETIQLQEEALKIAHAQKQAAVANELAVKQFEAQVLNSKGLEREVLLKIIETENQLNFILGRFPQLIARDRTGFLKALPEEVSTGLPSDLLRNRPDVRRAEFDLRVSEAEVKSARAAFYPSLTITGGAGYQAYRTAFLFSSPESIAYALVGSLTAPLINRAAIKREFKTATALQQEAIYNYQKTILNGYMEVNTEMARINGLNEIYALKSRETEVMSVSIETSAELFKTGRANYMEVLMAQQNALKSKLELVTTKQQQFNAAINIYKALGGGWK